MIAALLICGGAGAQAQDRHAALIVDANNGQVLHAAHADEPRFPASLTKMMTLYMAFEAIEQGRATYATRIRISQEAASQPPTRLDLDPGETITLIDAMKGLITKSANDAAVAIAEHLGGTEARFARMMTDKARLFGMSRTTFRNASGLPDPGQVTTARDMVRLALRLQDDFPRHYQLFSLRSFSYEGSTYRNHNNLLYRFQGTDGIKTGYTRASGFNLVSSVRRGGRHVVGAIFGGQTASRRDDAMQLLLSRALVQSSPYRTRLSAPVLVAATSPAVRPRAESRPEPQPTVAAPVHTAWAPPVQREAPRPVMVPPRPRPQQPEPVVAAAARPVAPPAPVLAVRPQVVRGEPAVARGMPPSTFQQQASQLSRDSSPLPPPYAVRGPSVAEPLASVGAGGFEIQIGAFPSAGEATRALSDVRSRAGDVLRGANERVVPYAKESRNFYRARFVGLDSRSAAGACLELRRRQIDCFVMRAE